jgi:hypothetical protein
MLVDYAADEGLRVSETCSAAASSVRRRALTMSSEELDRRA